MDAAALRAEFPVCERLAFFNAGSFGPLPRAAAASMAEAAERAATEGRARPYFERLEEVRSVLRGAYAAVLGADAADVALTTSTSEGMARVVAGIGLGEGDEVLVAEGEHPGLLGPLIGARARLGIRIRTAPLARLADAAGDDTRLIACSHVAWTTGELAPAALADVGRRIPVLLDGAQGAGAVPVDVAALGCAFYAAAGQKWLCGPMGTGMLWIAPAWRDRLEPIGLAYMNLEEPALGLGAAGWPDARAHDAPALSLEAATAALAAHGVLAASGWDAVLARAAALSGRLASALDEAGRDVAPRGPTTLVSWASADPEAEVARLLAAGVVVRSFPGLPYVRASVGAWNGEDDLDRLLRAL